MDEAANQQNDDDHLPLPIGLKTSIPYSSLFGAGQRRWPGSETMVQGYRDKAQRTKGSYGLFQDPELVMRAVLERQKEPKTFPVRK